jgi:hypothetical protein
MNKPLDLQHYLHVTMHQRLQLLLRPKEQMRRRLFDEWDQDL